MKEYKNVQEEEDITWGEGQEGEWEDVERGGVCATPEKRIGKLQNKGKEPFIAFEHQQSKTSRSLPREEVG